MTGRIGRRLAAFMRSDAAATAIEYGLVAGVMAMALTAGLDGLGTELINLFDKIAAGLR